MRRTSGRSGYFVKPRDNAPYVNGHSRDHLLQMRLRQPAITGTPSTKRPNTLGDGSFNPRPSRVALLSGLGGVNSPCLLQRFVLFSGQEFEEPGLAGRAGTQAARRARNTILRAELRRK